MNFKDFVKLAESTEDPKLETHLKPMVEAVMTKQLDKAFREDEGNQPLALRTRQPTIVKVSDEAFYAKTAAAACKIMAKRRLRMQDAGVAPAKKG